MKSNISIILSKADQERVVDSQIRWKFLKYEIRKFTKKFSKTISLDARIERDKLEQVLKLFGSDLQNYRNQKEYSNCKNKLESLYEDMANGIRIRSRCE